MSIPLTLSGKVARITGGCFDGMLVRLLLRELKSERASSAKDNL
ncbi:MAG: hypothetical protein WCA49_00165 [Candidatus Sulfotelmatobacter sp.]